VAWNRVTCFADYGKADVKASLTRRDIEIHHSNGPLLAVGPITAAIFHKYLLPNKDGSR